MVGRLYLGGVDKIRIRCDDVFRSVRIYQRVTGGFRCASGGTFMANPEKLHADTYPNRKSSGSYALSVIDSRRSNDVAT